MSAGSEFTFIELSDFLITTSPGFTDWLAGQNISLAFTSPVENNLFLIGVTPQGELSVDEQRFDYGRGLAVMDDQSLFIATQYQIWRLQNSLPDGQTRPGGYDRYYFPQQGYTLGQLDMHDIAVNGAGQIYFANTALNCLALASQTSSFTPYWKPPFISELVAEDRCHLNGIAMRDGRPAYVSCFGQSDEQDGWRQNKASGGCVLDVDTGEVVCSGLCMPHSPRWHKGRLWLVNSGQGELGWVDLEQGRFAALAFAPGYLRGLAFSGDYAIAGSSQPRHGNSFAGLPLDERMQNQAAHRGLFIIHLESGEIEHWLRLEGGKGEINDVGVLPGVRQPMAAGLTGLEIQQMVTVGPMGHL